MLVGGMCLLTSEISTLTTEAPGIPLLLLQCEERSDVAWAEHTGLESLPTTLSYFLDVQGLWKLYSTRRMPHGRDLKIIT